MIPQDYKDDFSNLESLKRGVSFTTKRLGLTLDSGVDRLIFKNQDYLKFFDKKFLFHEGYFSTENEYNNAISKKNNNDKKQKNQEIEVGSDSIAILNKKQNIKFYSRIKDVLQYDNSKYYLLEYKKKKPNTKTITDKLKSGFNTFTGNNSEKEIKKSIEWRDTKNANSSEIKSIYADFEYPIPAKFVEIDPMTVKDKFYKLNDEIFIPFENPDFFVVFHILKYCFKKALNLGRVNKLYYILKTFKNKLKSSEDYYNYYKKKELPVIETELINNKEIGKNVDDANNLLRTNEELTNTVIKAIVKEAETHDEKDEGSNNNNNVGGKKTKKNKQTNRKTKKNIQYGGLSVSGTIKGDINVIIDKLSKYIFTQNLKSQQKDEELKGTMLEYIIEEQQLFIKAAIYYFDIDIKLEDITYEKYDNNAIEKYITDNNYINKGTYDLIRILADKIWPKRQHGGDTTDNAKIVIEKIKKGIDKNKEFIKNAKIKDVAENVIDDFNKKRQRLKEGIDKNKEIVKDTVSKAKTFLKEASNAVFANNVILNRIFDIAFRKMVDRRINKLFISSSSSNQVPSEIDIKQVVKFYSAILFSCATASHFTCTTALNTTAMVLTNPLAFLGASIPGLPVLPPFLKMLVSANTPQCNVSCMLFTYVAFRMWWL